MDGTGVVAAIIVLLFLFNFQPFKGQSGSPQKTDQYAYYQADNSAWNYRSVSEEGMRAVIKKYNPNIYPGEAGQIIIATNRYAKENDLDPRLLLALMARESRFDSRAISSSGAKGLGQIMPANFASLGITDPSDIDQGVRGLSRYLRQKLDEWQGQSDQLGLALASYLEGSGAIKRNGNTYSGHTAVYVSDILKIRSTI